MSNLLAKVEMMWQFVELYEDEVHVQMPLSLMHVIKLRDITDIDFKKANFFIAGKMTIKYREKGASQSANFTFNFFLNDGMMTLVSMLNDQRLKLSGEKEAGPEVIVKEVIKVRCQYCEGLMDEKDDVCPVCGRPR
jgi:hypothetical protein